MDRFRSPGPSGRRRLRIRPELLVFAWTLRSLVTPFARQSLALNTIERGRAWHWRLLPSGWADARFILRHGQSKTKRAFARFFPGIANGEVRPPKQSMRIRKPAIGQTPLAWETVKAVFAENPKLKKAGVLAGAQALLNEHLENPFGRFSFDIDLHTSRDVEKVNALFTSKERKQIQLISRTNPEMFVYEIRTHTGPVRLEIATLPHKLAPVTSKHIPGLKVVRLADIIDAKISALSARGFARDFVDLYTAHIQKTLNWQALLMKASANQMNDYNPLELENNLKLLEEELEKGTPEIPCTHPPPIGELTTFLEDLRLANAAVARELTGLNGLEAGEVE